MGNIELLVTTINNLLVNTKFQILIHGDFFNTVDESTPDNEKYVTITERGDVDSCYMDWKYNNFNEEELKKYCQEIPKYQGSGNDNVAQQYQELAKLILEILK